MSKIPRLAYEAMPPLSVPMRFFLTAPLFGMMAGLLLLIDDAVLVSRWTPGALAAVHLFTVGFMLQVMLGALLQILPVVAGASFSAPLRIAAFTHGTTSAGAVGLCWGLGRGQPGILVAGATLLGLGLAFFLYAAAAALRRAPQAQPGSRTQRDLRLALTGLVVTTVLGLLLAWLLAGGFSMPVELTSLVNLHAGWGWLGWGGLLLAATSWVVVPMFQVTPVYPARFTSLWAPTVLTVLLLWTGAMLSGFDPLILAVALALLVLAGAYAGTTLNLLLRTRRTVPDASSRTFRLAMAASIGGLLALLASFVSDAPHWPVLAGVLILHGGFASAISAMLYKIVPFLVWLHLTEARVKVANVKKLLPEAPIQAQLRLHGAVLIILLVAVFLPQAGRIAGAAMLVEFGWLLANIVRVLRVWARAMEP
ncbi:hypothetical protein ACG33_11915 [Steroidobacter denitrificans]|uniref:Uncharacterized protein n=1 Tax=Steroidobacter denitrificans TaxID=465721 RepID=A0A127FDS6_STEDE|nr:hypothetical protein [Steroidobacter denitrificans]AMN47789.1 hypothetical protein ACG33_11915 [Steroidobacter denitrificans]